MSPLLFQERSELMLTSLHIQRCFGAGHLVVQIWRLISACLRCQPAVMALPAAAYTRAMGSSGQGDCQGAAT